MCAHFFFNAGCYSFVIPLGFQMEDMVLRRPQQSVKASHTPVCIQCIFNFALQHSLLSCSPCLSPGCRSHQCEVTFWNKTGNNCCSTTIHINYRCTRRWRLSVTVIQRGPQNSQHHSQVRMPSVEKRAH